MNFAPEIKDSKSRVLSQVNSAYTCCAQGRVFGNIIHKELSETRVLAARVALRAARDVFGKTSLTGVANLGRHPTLDSGPVNHPILCLCSSPRSGYLFARCRTKALYVPGIGCLESQFLGGLPLLRYGLSCLE